MAWEYTEKTKQLFLDAIHGKPGTHLGEIENPDGVGEHGSIACGDAIRFMFRVERHPTDPAQDRIVEARYLTFGCTSAIASSEALCAILEQRRCTPIEALQIKNSDIVEFLGGLPEQKIHCSVMGAEALQAAVRDWAKRRGVDLAKYGIHLPTEEEEHGRIVCRCFSVTEPYLRRKIKELNLRTIPDIINALKAGGACMSCHHAPGGLQDILDDIWGKQQTGLPVVGQISNGYPQQPAPASSTAGSDGKQELTPYQFMKKVEQVINERVRPLLRRDGGDIEIVDIKGHLVYCRLHGACAGCCGAAQTLKLMVEQALKENVDERIRVIQV